MRSNMKRILSIIGFATALFSLASQVEADSTIHWVTDRDYRLSVLDNNNQPILSVKIEYQGKKPYGNEVNDHNWKFVDTDFYRESFKNLTDSTINIQKISYSLDRGRLHTPRVKNKEKVKAMYGATEINANASIHKNNAWVWSKRNNKLHRKFLFFYNNEKIEVDIPLIYRQ